MKINDEQIKFFQWANKILQTPNHFPDGNRVIDEYKLIFKEELEKKKSPYYRSLSPGCMSCIRHCVFTVKNELVKLGILDINGEFTDGTDK